MAAPRIPTSTLPIGQTRADHAVGHEHAQHLYRSKRPLQEKFNDVKKESNRVTQSLDEKEQKNFHGFVGKPTSLDQLIRDGRAAPAGAAGDAARAKADAAEKIIKFLQSKQRTRKHDTEIKDDAANAAFNKALPAIQGPRMSVKAEEKAFTQAKEAHLAQANLAKAHAENISNSMIWTPTFKALLQTAFGPLTDDEMAQAQTKHLQEVTTAYDQRAQKAKTFYEGEEKLYADEFKKAEQNVLVEKAFEAFGFEDDEDLALVRVNDEAECHRRIKRKQEILDDQTRLYISTSWSFKKSYVVMDGDYKLATKAFRDDEAIKRYFLAWRLKNPHAKNFTLTLTPEDKAEGKAAAWETETLTKVALYFESQGVHVSAKNWEFKPTERQLKHIREERLAKQKLAEKPDEQLQTSIAAQANFLHELDTKAQKVAAQASKVEELTQQLKELITSYPHPTTPAQDTEIQAKLTELGAAHSELTLCRIEHYAQFVAARRNFHDQLPAYDNAGRKQFIEGTAGRHVDALREGVIRQRDAIGDLDAAIAPRAAAAAGAPAYWQNALDVNVVGTRGVMADRTAEAKEAERRHDIDVAALRPR